MTTTMTRRAPPPPPVARKLRAKQASRHVRRVTLNIIRLSAACPDDLRPTLEKLATTLDWQFDRLMPVEQEQVYAMVDEDLADRAKEEFQADLESLVDHRHNEANCELCGHQHIRFEFALVNTAGGRSTMTGSTCIETYGLNVDGEATAEEALKALRRAIASAKRKADRDDWQKAHPTHEADIEALRRDFDVLRFNHQPMGLYQFLNDGWNSRCKSMVGKIRTLLKYYDREGFLTDLRTGQLYSDGDGPGPYPKTAAAMVAELDNARTKKEAIVDRWNRFIDACPKMEGWERRKVEYFRDRGFVPEDLYDGSKRMIRNIHKRNGSPNLKTTT